MSQDGQREPKGRPKGAEGLPKESKRKPKSAQGTPKALQRRPKEAKGEDIYISKNSRSTAQADVMLGYIVQGVHLWNQMSILKGKPLKYEKLIRLL